MGNIIGIKLADGSFYPVMEEGKPFSKKLELTTVRDDQSTVQLHLYRSATGSMEDAEYVDTLLIENLVPHPKQENTLKNFLNIIETQDALKELVKNGYDGNVNVYIGQENAFEDLKDFTIITYKQKINDKELGTIGLIGPKRMDYKKVIPIIKYVGDALQEKIKQGGSFDGREQGDES